MTEKIFVKDKHTISIITYFFLFLLNMLNKMFFRLMVIRTSADTMNYFDERPR